MSISFNDALLLLLITIISATPLIQTSLCLDFKYPYFKNDDGFQTLILSEDSRIFKDAIQVTPDVLGAPITNAYGRAVYNQRFKLRNAAKNQTASFNTTFVLNITPQTSPGGEGLAFILAAESSRPAGSNGQWLGIVNSTTNGTSAANIVAVEFDTRKSYPEDIDSNHVGLNINSVFSIVQKPLIDFGVNLSSATDVFVIVRYDGKNISIFASMSNKTEDQLRNLVFSHPLNVSVLPDDVYVGFSGSTSNYTELNCVRSWEFHGIELDGANRKLTWIWITVSVVIVAVLVFGVMLFFWMKKRRLNDSEEGYTTGIEGQLQGFSIAPRAQKFEFKELKKATNNFNHKNRLGRGGFGTVYKGNLKNKEVAVKRVSKDSRQGKQEFISEVTIIGSLHHKNLVKLIGWCYEKKDLLLVYEFMPNGSLDKLISMDNSAPPNWERRQNIICGAAEALDYLHNGCERTVLHRDIKSSNIMLDSKFEAKLGDFGLARAILRSEQTHHSTREIAGTPGYMAPEIFLTSRATAETDVYAFGVLILEVVCGKKPGNPHDLGGYDGSIGNWVWEFHRNGKIVEAVDARIDENDFVKEEIEYLLILGLACCHPNPHKRPTIRNVLQVLKGEANPPILPNEKPSFMWPPMPPSFKEDNSENSLRETHLSPFTTLTGR